MILKMAAKHKVRDACWPMTHHGVGWARVRLARQFLLQCRPSS